MPAWLNCNVPPGPWQFQYAQAMQMHQPTVPTSPVLRSVPNLFRDDEHSYEASSDQSDEESEVEARAHHSRGSRYSTGQLPTPSLSPMLQQLPSMQVPLDSSLPAASQPKCRGLFGQAPESSLSGQGGRTSSP